MKKANLPIENAFEPNEGAREPQANAESADSVLPANEVLSPYVEHNSSKKITFAKTTEYNECASSQNMREFLSQPDAHLSYRQRLIWLQKRRTTGLWAQCDSCDRWRYLPAVLDRYELPNKWHCWMNPDKAIASCSVPETPICVRDEEDLIHSEYSAGSVVWAQLAGWPWWPAMVDDCPDTEQFYWLDGFSDIPTHYNVVFFDSKEVTRAWIAPKQLKPYAANKKQLPYLLKNNPYQKRLENAMVQADQAEKLPLPTRLTKYSFISRHKGKINSPKKIKNADLVKYQKKFNKQFNVAIPIENLESGEDTDVENKSNQTSKKRNVIVLETPKNNTKRKRGQRNNFGHKNRVDLDTNDCSKISELNNKDSENITPSFNSMVAHVGSNIETGFTNTVETAVTNTVETVDTNTVEIADTNTAETADTNTAESADTNTAETAVTKPVETADTDTVDSAVTNTVDDDTSKTYIPENECVKKNSSQRTEDLIRIPTPNSDDFEF